MSYRYLVIPVLSLVFFAVFFSGCTAVSVGLPDTHNTTLAVQSYNSWTEMQKTYGQQATTAISQIGAHLTTYNSEIAQGSPDINMLRAMLRRTGNSSSSGQARKTDLIAQRKSSLPIPLRSIITLRTRNRQSISWHRI